MKFNKENKETFIKFTPDSLTNEAREFISYWGRTNEDNFEYYKTDSYSNWILAKRKDKDYWYSLSFVEGCSSSHYGDTNHVKTIYKLN